MSLPSESLDSPAMAAQASAALRRTPLHDFHLAHGARMVSFAGYEMPVQYPPGVIKEHQHSRTAAGLFDVSHMGQIVLRPRGSVAEVAAALERLVPADIVGLAPGRQRYTVFTTAAGGILDDLMVANLGSHLMLVVNAATKEADEQHLRRHLTDCGIEMSPDRALLALQGPQAEGVLAEQDPAAASMRFMDVRALRIAGIDCLVSRSGYTGEDGFEISMPAAAAERLAAALLSHDAVAPIGLAARDTLRLEAGLCLYGSDLDQHTTPVEGAIDWSIQKCRRAGGSRAGGFPGADVVLQELAGGPRRRRVGLRPEGRAPVRGGTPLYADADAASPIGIVTSGGYGPTVGAPIAMGYVGTGHAQPGTRLFAAVRGVRLPVRVAPLAAVPHRYKR